MKIIYAHARGYTRVEGTPKEVNLVDDLLEMGLRELAGVVGDSGRGLRNDPVSDVRRLSEGPEERELCRRCSHLRAYHFKGKGACYADVDGQNCGCKGFVA